jgi:hypothetical protein
MTVRDTPTRVGRSLRWSRRDRLCRKSRVRDDFLQASRPGATKGRVRDDFLQASRVWRDDVQKSSLTLLLRAEAATTGRLDDENVAGVHLDLTCRAEFLDAAIHALDPVASERS